MISQGKAVGIFMFLSLLIMTFALVPPFSDWLVLAANNVYPYPGTDIHTDYFVGALLGFLFGIAVLIAPVPAALRPALLLGWTVKLATALIVMPVYEYAYGLDVDGYFSINDFPLTAGPIFGNGTSNIRALAWLVFQVIGPNFHGGKVVFTFIGFLGIYIGYRGAVLYLRRESPLLLLLTLLSPTGLFWSSLLGKDPICLFGVGLYTYGCLGWLTTSRKQYLLAAALGTLIAAYIRSYFLPILAIPLTIAFFIQTRRPLVRMLLMPFILVGAFYSVAVFRDYFKIDSFDAFTRYQANLFSNWRGGSAVALPLIDSPVALLLVAPFGAFTALFRPLIFEAHNPFAFAASLDNTFLLILAIYAFARSRIRELFQPELLWMSTFVLLWSTMYGLGSGNLGAISRFKIQILPTFITLLLFMARKRTPAAKAAAAPLHA